MSRVDAAAGSDRLPWLSDEPQAKPVKRDSNPVLGWAAAAVLVVAGGAFWLGTRSVEEQPVPARHAPPATTVPLPEAHPAEQAEVRIPTQPQVNPAPAPQVRPTPSRELRLAAPPVERPAPQVSGNTGASTGQASEAILSPAVRATQAAKPAIAPARPQAVPLRPWNPHFVEGAAGRLVQVGAFGSISQAKRGWWSMVRAYPAMSRLPALVRPARNSRGRIFYRFQLGTTSQAHSEILCQRMQRIRLSCAVVGLPWKVKVER